MDKPKRKSFKILGSPQKIIEDLRIILSHIASARKLQLIGLLVLQTACGLAEILSLGALLPFLSALSNAEKLLATSEIHSIANLFSIKNEAQLIVYASIAFVAAFTAVNLFKIFILRLQIRMSVALGSDLNKLFFSKILNQDFEYHLNSNSAILISRTVTDLSSLLQFIASAMMILTQGISIFAIVSAVVIYNPVAATIIFASTLGIYLVIADANNKQMIKNSRDISNSYAVAIHNLQVALNGIRDVLLGNKQDEFVGRYTLADKAFRTASSNTRFLSAMPRYLIEIAGVGILVSVAAFLTVTTGGVFGTLPLMGALAMATIRILPAAQSVYSCFASMQAVHVSVERTLQILDMDVHTQPNQGLQEIQKPKTAIELSGVWFRFKGNEEKPGSPDWILKDVSLSIPVNTTVALVGKTGSGKTTISDIVLGLLCPNKGSLLIDTVAITAKNLTSWRNHVASVPQSIFLIDATVKENVAFGEPLEHIDLNKVKKVCALAQIDELIESRPAQYDEIIGENGLRLSGGQRQRIGIARALYKDASLLVLDEATSALDNETEKTVMQTISRLHGQQTVLIIAHRLETIKNADLIYEIQNGKVVAQGTYEDLMARSETFRQMVQAGNNSDL